MKKLLIVDDDVLITQSLNILFSKESDFEVFCVNDGQQAYEFCKNISIDLVLMDIQMPILNGIMATRKIKREYPHIQIMMLTTFEDERNIRLSMIAGAEGYIIKSLHFSDIIKKVRAVLSGVTSIDKEALDNLFKSNDSRFDDLTVREYEISQLVSEGLSNKEISEQLFISEGTVRNNLSVILEKLHIRDRTQLALLFVKK